YDPFPLCSLNSRHVIRIKTRFTTFRVVSNLSYSTGHICVPKQVAGDHPTYRNAVPAMTSTGYVVYIDLVSFGVQSRLAFRLLERGSIIDIQGHLDPSLHDTG